MLTPAWTSVANWREKTWRAFGVTFLNLRAPVEPDAVFCSSSVRASSPFWRSWSRAVSRSGACRRPRDSMPRASIAEYEYEAMSSLSVGCRGHLSWSRHGFAIRR